MKKLNSDFVRVLQTAEVKDRIATQGAEPVGSTPEAFQKYLVEQSAKYAKIVRATGMQNE